MNRTQSAAPPAEPAESGPSLGPPHARAEKPLPIRTKIAFGAPTIASAAMGLLIAIHLTKFYADVVLAPLSYIAVAIAVARAFDAITDPVMGWLSDRTRSRWGRRRPYIAIAAPFCGLSFFALFSPPQHMTPRNAAAWFGVSFLLFFLFDTICVVPHNALGPELTLDYHERSNLYGWRGGCTVLGTFVAAIAPSVLNTWTGNPRTAFSSFAASAGLVLALAYWAFVGHVRERAEFAEPKPNPLVPGVRRALANRPFRILLATYAVFAIAGAIPGLLLPFMNSYVIRSPDESQFLAIGLGTYIGMGFLFVPVWVRVSHRIGKRPAWLCAIAIGIVTNAGAWLLGKGDVGPAIVILAIAGIQFGAPFVLAPSIQADAIDYDELYTGRRREAQYGAFWSIVPKLIAIPSAAIPIALLDAIGYVPNQEQTAIVLLTIRTLFALVPASFAVIAFCIAWRLPITETAHRAILEGIDCHRRGESAVDPLTGAIVRPPHAREIEEETGWFLDHFSVRELRRAGTIGPDRLVGDVKRTIVISGAAFAVLTWGALWQIGDLSVPPPVCTAPTVALAGLALAALCFHALRLGPARQLRRKPIPREIIAAHIADKIRMYRGNNGGS